MREIHWEKISAEDETALYKAELCFRDDVYIQRTIEGKFKVYTYPDSLGVGFLLQNTCESLEEAKQWVNDNALRLIEGDKVLYNKTDDLDMAAIECVSEKIPRLTIRWRIADDDNPPELWAAHPTPNDTVFICRKAPDVYEISSYHPFSGMVERKTCKSLASAKRWVTVHREELIRKLR